MFLVRRLRLGPRMKPVTFSLLLFGGWLILVLYRRVHHGVYTRQLQIEPKHIANQNQDHDYLVHMNKKHNVSLAPTTSNRGSIIPNFERWVHLDLKGAPPKVSYYKELFPWLYANGATGLLIEYEDMFPYEGDLEILKTKYAYSPKEVKEILSLANENHLNVIPLVQTFGHFEFVLKQNKYKHIREHPGSAKNLNPAHNESLPLVKSMINQIMAAHPRVKYLHLGCDEVFYLGVSIETKERMRQGWSRHDLYLDHLKTVASYVRSQYPTIIPLIWDDMLRGMDVNMLKKHQLGSLVEPMIWNYVPHPEKALRSTIWSKYNQVFKRAWIASAFKGATGQAQDVVPIQHHLQNHQGWLTILQDPKKGGSVKVAGITFTGWQKYNHFLPLCELLPVGLPSLAICLEIILYGTKSPALQSTVSSKLKCNGTFSLTIDEASMKIHCSFPGVKVYRVIHDIHHLVAKLGSQGANCNSVKKAFEQSKLVLKSVMEEIYFEDSIDLWFKQHVTNKHVGKLLDDCKG